MKPTIGRVVHYIEHGGGGAGPDGDTFAALVVRVTYDGHRELVDLVAFSSYSVRHYHDVPFAEEPTSGHWSWPPREPSPARCHRCGLVDDHTTECFDLQAKEASTR